MKSKKARKIFAGYPEILIEKGKLSQKALENSRLTVEELLSSLRVLGYADLDSVYYAILEPSGNISVIPKAPERPPTAKELCTPVTENGAQHIVVSDGKLNLSELNKQGYDLAWLNSLVKKNKLKDVSEIFFLGIDDAKNVCVVPKEKKS